MYLSRAPLLTIGFRQRVRAAELPPRIYSTRSWEWVSLEFKANGILCSFLSSSFQHREVNYICQSPTITTSGVTYFMSRYHNSRFRTGDHSSLKNHDLQMSLIGCGIKYHLEIFPVELLSGRPRLRLTRPSENPPEKTPDESPESTQTSRRLNHFRILNVLQSRRSMATSLLNIVQY